MNEMDSLMKQIEAKNSSRRGAINKAVLSLLKTAERYKIFLGAAAPEGPTQARTIVGAEVTSAASPVSKPSAVGRAGEGHATAANTTAARPPPLSPPSPLTVPQTSLMEGERGGNSRWTDADPKARGRPPPLNPPSPLTAPQMSVWKCTVCQTCNPTTALSCLVCTLLQSEVTDSGKNRDSHHHGTSRPHGTSTPNPAQPNMEADRRRAPPEEHDDDIAEDDDTASESSEDGSEARLPSTAAAEGGVASD